MKDFYLDMSGPIKRSTVEGLIRHTRELTKVYDMLYSLFTQITEEHLDGKHDILNGVAGDFEKLHGMLTWCSQDAQKKLLGIDAMSEALSIQEEIFRLSNNFPCAESRMKEIIEGNKPPLAADDNLPPHHRITG